MRRTVRLSLNFSGEQRQRSMQKAFHHVRVVRTVRCGHSLRFKKRWRTTPRGPRKTSTWRSRLSARSPACRGAHTESDGEFKTGKRGKCKTFDDWNLLTASFSKETNAPMTACWPLSIPTWIRPSRTCRRQKPKVKRESVSIAKQAIPRCNAESGLLLHANTLLCAEGNLQQFGSPRNDDRRQKSQEVPIVKKGRGTSFGT